MKLPIVEIVRRDKTFEGIAAFERDAIGECDASAKIHRVVIAALRSVVKAVVAESVLQQDPRRLTAQTEAIAQAGRSAHADGIEGVEAIPYVTSHISAEIQSQVARRLETVVHTYIASPPPVISHVGGAIGIGEITVINNACLRLEPPFGVNRTRNEHEENQCCSHIHTLVSRLGCRTFVQTFAKG